ncbi:hypothetical protein ccbrp13_19510 [Ktedonobacteria bacterium brp13]|nr:hypothetical protein ccbrp13_19510 [Ktedonobacteria bacterium brp13]
MKNISRESSVFALPHEELDPRIHIFRRIFVAPDKAGELQVDAYVLRTERFLIFCDTLLCPSDVALMVEHVTRTPDETPGIHERHKRQWLVINSHSDWDHVWGNAYFTQRSERSEQSESSEQPEQSEHPLPPIIGHTLNAQRQSNTYNRTFLCDYKNRYPLFEDVQHVPPTLSFEQQMLIDGGDLTLELLHAPGHSADHIAVWLPQLRTLLAFDAVEWPFPSIEDAQSVSALRETLQRFLSLDPRFVLCSHGTAEGVEGIRILKQNYLYIRRLEEDCQALLAEQELTKEMIKQEDCADLIGFAYDEASAGMPTGDDAYYRHVHQENVRNVLRYLLSEDEDEDDESGEQE